MIINLILTMVVLTSALALTLVQVNREVTAASRAAMKQHGWGGCSITAFWTLSALAVAGLWTWYAVDVQDWRFAAIVWTPIVARWISYAAEKTRYRDLSGKVDSHERRQGPG